MEQENPVLGKVALELSLLCAEKLNQLSSATETHLSPQAGWVQTGDPEPHTIPTPTPSVTAPGWGWRDLQRSFRAAWPRGSEPHSLGWCVGSSIIRFMRPAHWSNLPVTDCLLEPTLSVWLPLSGGFLLRIKWKSNLSGSGKQGSHLELLRSAQVELKLSKFLIKGLQWLLVTYRQSYFVCGKLTSFLIP